jgi:hypothetical protein
MGHVKQMVEVRNAYILAVKPHRTRKCGGDRYNWNLHKQNVKA